jgi:hypothetical protein
MTDPTTILGLDRVELDLDEGSFPRDAVYGAAFAFIDRWYVRLDRVAEGRIGIVLRAKPGHDGRDPQTPAAPFDGEAVAAELCAELFGQAFRQRLVEDGRELTASIFAGAHGGGEVGLGAGGLDDLLDPGDLGDAGAFDDPLGIALSWEEKYAKKPAGEGGGGGGSP